MSSSANAAGGIITCYDVPDISRRGGANRMHQECARVRCSATVVPKDRRPRQSLSFSFNPKGIVRGALVEIERPYPLMAYK